MGMSVNLNTNLDGTGGSGGSIGGSDGRPSASLTVTLTRDGAEDEEQPTDCSNGPLAPKWYNPVTNAWDLSTLTVYPV